MGLGDFGGGAGGAWPSELAQASWASRSSVLTSGSNASRTDLSACSFSEDFALASSLDDSGSSSSRTPFVVSGSKREGSGVWSVCVG